MPPLSLTRREAQRAVEQAEARCVAVASAGFSGEALAIAAKHLARCNAALDGANRAAGKVLVTPSKTSQTETRSLEARAG